MQTAFISFKLSEIYLNPTLLPEAYPVFLSFAIICVFLSSEKAPLSFSSESFFEQLSTIMIFNSLLTFLKLFVLSIVRS